MTRSDLNITNYKDGRGYVFVSYASKDADAVFGDYIIPLQEQYGLRVFFDQDFKNQAGDHWSKQMYENIRSARLVLIFESPNYVCSRACFLEMCTAIAYGRPILKIHLGTPKVSNDTSEGTKINYETKNLFNKIGDKLSHETDKASLAYQVNAFYPDVLDYIVTDGAISIERLSESFCECIARIKGNRIDKSSGLLAIRKSIETEVKKGNQNIADIYEEVSTSSSSTKKLADRSGEKTAVPEAKIAPTPVEKRVEDQGKARRTGSVEQYAIYGKKMEGNQSQMMITAIEEIVKRHPDKLEDIDFALVSVEAKPLKALKDVKYFTVGKECTVEGKVFSIGTSFGRDAKMAQIRKAIMAAGEDPRLFDIAELFDEKQMDKAMEVFESIADASQSEGETGTVSRGGEEYTYYGVKGSGNQTQMMTEVISAIVERHYDLVDEFSDDLLCFAVDSMDNLRGISYFRTGESFRHGDDVYSIGTSFGRDAKLAQIRKAILIAGEDPREFDIADLFTEKQLNKAVENHKNKAKNPVQKKEVVLPDSEQNQVDLLACFLSRYNNDAAALLGYRSVNAAMTAYADIWGEKVSTIKNIRDTFDPFFPESGRRGWWQKMDSIGERRKAIIDMFKTFSDVNEAYEYLCKNIPDLEQ